MTFPQLQQSVVVGKDQIVVEGDKEWAFRNGGTILDKFKSLHSEWYLTFKEEIHEIGGYIWIHSIAYVSNGEETHEGDGWSLPVEFEPRAQAAATSMARKYALQSVFALGDANEDDAELAPRKDGTKPKIKKNTKKVEKANDTAKVEKAEPTKEVVNGASVAQEVVEEQPTEDIVPVEEVPIVEEETVAEPYMDLLAMLPEEPCVVPVAEQEAVAEPIEEPVQTVQPIVEAPVTPVSQNNAPQTTMGAAFDEASGLPF
jgi:hypothetical protein